MIEHSCPIRKVSPDDGWHYWFGYYDKCPWSPDGTKLLAHRAPFCDHFPAPNDFAEVGFLEGWETDAPRFTKIGQTTAWNWQQGAMLRWCKGEPRFNTSDTEPVYTVHTSTGVALTLDFGRLSRLRPEYGHPGQTDPAPDDPHPTTCGISRLDADAKTLILSLDQLDRITADGSARAGGDLHQHVNHLAFNPSGTRFC
ncbi:hypothetical protein MNBD_PLANCTO03-144, partial [hydrothermal vent metagenome]